MESVPCIPSTSDVASRDASPVALFGSAGTGSSMSTHRLPSEHTSQWEDPARGTGPAWLPR